MSLDQEFNCIFCKESFENKEALQVHFRKHGDPSFNINKNSQNDGQSTSEKNINEQVEMVSCDVCSKEFPTISKAITHKHKVHPDHAVKYFCPWCGKLFTLKHLYNKHMETNHIDAEKYDEKCFPCDSCNVDFFNPASMLYHNKFFHRQETDLPSIGHSKKFKMWNQEAIPIYYCSFCGEEFDNKVNLNKHFNDEHNDENQNPNEVFRCPLCDAIFYHLDAYELHLTFHSTDDLYTDQNEMLNEIVEFSLESVPPGVEKVETCVPQDPESTMSAIGIDKFLEITMDQSEEQQRVKSKKHKKHKKSKKSAITLDEFLNMNKDVFGEGLDFQGAEEVPTQVVTKRLKSKKQEKPTNVYQYSDLQKLQRQGIVVKKTVGDNLRQTHGNNLNVCEGGPRYPVQQHNILNKTSQDSNVLSTSSAVLSKLINQSNSQIKIVKRTMPEKLQNKIILNSSEDNVSLEHMEDNINKLDQTEKADECAKDKENDISDSKSKNAITIDDCFESGNSEKNLDVSNNATNKDECADQVPTKRDDDCKSPNMERESLKEPDLHLTEHNTEINDKEHPNNDDVDDYAADTETDDHHVDDTESKNDTKQDKSNSLEALKHLSHLITIKPVNQNKSILTDEKRLITNENDKNKAQGSGILETNEEMDVDSSVTTSHNDSVSSKFSLDKHSSLNTIKSLNKNITVKNVPKTMIFSNESDNEQQDDNKEISTNFTPIKAIYKTHTIENLGIKLTNFTVIPTKQSPKTMQKMDSKTDVISNDNEQNQSSTNLFKSLSIMTAKPTNTVHSIKKSTILLPQKKLDSESGIKNVCHKQEIEIFNIDDSDSDEYTESNDHNTKDNKNCTSLDALKNLSKHITVKPVNQIKKVMVKVEKEEVDENGDGHFEDEGKTDETNSNNKHQQVKKQLEINNALKYLSKNITVKSRNSSPSQSANCVDQNIQDAHIDTNNAGTDSDSTTSKLKITEMDNASDDELPPDDIDKAVSSPQENVTVQYPDECNSDEGENFNSDDEDHIAEIEKQIQSNMLQNSGNKHSASGNIKKLSNNVTIKPMNDNTATDQDPQQQFSSSSLDIPGIPKHLGNQLSIKPFKQQRNVSSNINKNSSAGTVMQQSAYNQNTASTSSSNQVKEVTTVKTFQTQTKTVIQEITTTVTKTIKTVNQTMKQQVNNTNNSNIRPIMVHPNVQGVNRNQSQKNYQGVVVRHSTPPIGAKIRSPLGTGTAVRSSKQMVPVRPGMNITNRPGPRFPGIRNVRPTIPSQSKMPLVGKTFKISPDAVISPVNKRPNSEDTTGPFSCFKKPKESLIPSLEDNGDAKVQFASSSHMSQSNFASTTKTVKGNSMVTSSQSKTEVSSSTQQLGRNRNMTRFCIVKSSQAKQAHVAESNATTKSNYEASTSKRSSTQDAIEKLQRQGLLVKKPRIEVHEDSDQSDHGSDDNPGPFSDDENSV